MTGTTGSPSVNLDGHEPGDVLHTQEWWGEKVDLDVYFLDPAEVTVGLEAAGIAVMTRTDREPWPGAELASRRCYLLCRRM